METTAMSEQLVEAYKATLDKGVTGILALLAVALVVGTLAYLWSKRTELRKEVNKGQSDKALVEMFSVVLEKHRNDSNTTISESTAALRQNIETREKYTLAFADVTYTLKSSIDAVGQLKSDITGRQSLVEGTVGDMNTRVQTLIGSVAELHVKVALLTTSVNSQQSDYPQITAAVKALTAEMHQTYELMIDTLRPPNHTLKTTNTPEGETP